MILYLYVVVALGAIKPQYLETINRVTMSGWFDQSFFGTQSNDQAVLIGLSLLFATTLLRSNEYRICLIAAFIATMASQQIFPTANLVLYASLAAFPITILGIILRAQATGQMNRKKIMVPRTVTLNLTVASFLSVAIVVEMASLIERVTSPQGSLQGSASVASAASLESGIFHSFAIISPLMLSLITFSFLYRNYLILAVQRIWLRRERRQYQQNSRHDVARSGTITIGEPKAEANNLPNVKEDIRRPEWDGWLILAAAVAVSIVISLYPHLPIVNPSGAGVSTDERAYLGWLSAMQNMTAEQNPHSIVNYVFTASGGDRPLSLLLLHVAGILTGSFPTVVRYAPTVLAPAIVLASFVLARQGLKLSPWRINTRRAAIIAVFAALSPQIVVGVYAGFLANWIALVPALLSILFLAKTWDSKAQSAIRTNAAIFFGLLIVTMLCHVYIWGHLVVVAVIFLVLSIWSARRETSGLRIKALLLAAAIVASVAVDFAKSEAFGVPSGVSRDTGVAGYSFNLDNFATRWTTLSDTLWNYVGGYITAPILLALTLFWVFNMRMSSSSVGRVMLSMVFALSIPILFGSMEVQARLLYNTPFFIPAALALFGASRARLVSLLSVSFVILVLANYAMGAMSNLNLVVPDNAVQENPFLVP